MSLSDTQWEFLKDLSLLIQYAERKGWKLTGGELWRPDEVQDLYVKQGKSNTNESYHEKRLAIDLNLFIDEEYRTDSEAYEPLGKFWEQIRDENRWGGNFTTITDGNHFERTL